MKRTPWIPAALFGVLALSMLARVAPLGLVRENNLTPDGARFLNIARCLSRGQGFSTPEAWPAWLQPARLPTPETFKEPGYPAAIAALTPIAGDPFRAAQGLSLIAGLLIPWVVVRFGRRLGMDAASTALAGILAALSPVLIQQSVVVMAESVFTLVSLLALLAAAPRVVDTASSGRRRGAAIETPARERALDVGAGIFFGLAFLVRAQAVLLLPAMIALLAVGRSPRVALRRIALAAVGALVAVAPLMVRNLRGFGTPFHSDVAAFGLWPYTDPYLMTHRLDRPPGTLRFALGHGAQISRQVAESLVRFVHYTLPHDLLGHWLLLLPLALGGVIAVRRWRVWGFALAGAFTTIAFLLATHWIARYFAVVVPMFALLGALGLAELFRTLRALRSGALRAAATLALVVAFAAASSISLVRTWRDITPPASDERTAARIAAPWLRARLAPDEAVMAEVTSYWAWYADRPAVHPVIADSARFADVLRRLKVRVAAFSDSALADFVAHSPGARLPAALVPVPDSEVPGVRLFRVVP